MEMHRAGCSSPSPHCQETALPVNGSTSDSVTLIISAVVDVADDASEQITLLFGV